MGIIIFKAGRMIGPLDRESVIGMLARGEVSEHDLAQRAGQEVWIPLRRLLSPLEKATPIERATGFAREGGQRFWNALHADPMRVGLASLFLGCLLIIFPRWTFLLFVPALAAAVFAGSLLLTRRRIISGILLCVGALVLPAVFLLAGREEARPGVSFQLFGSPSIEAVVPPKPAVAAKPTPRPTLQGVALPIPVMPTTTPRPAPPI